MKYRYIILYGNIFSKRDWERLGCIFFQQQNFEILPLDCFTISRPHLEGNFETKNIKRIKQAIIIKEKKQLTKILDSVSKNDLVLMLLPLTKHTAWIYHYIKNINIDYTLQTSACLPPLLNLKDILSQKHRFNKILIDLKNRLFPDPSQTLSFL
ncbi:MAG: hypothetical protein HWE30_18490 [Methylocystaceae bacterium]|nr:hypothetical protein [Methylocystaceae bacterium]